MGGPIVGGGDVNVTGFTSRAGRPRAANGGAADGAPTTPVLAAADDGTSLVCAAAPADAAAPSPSTWPLPPPGTSDAPPAHRDSGLRYEYYSLSLGGVRPAAVPLGGGRLRVALTVGASASLRASIRDGHGRCSVEYSDGTAIDGGVAVAAAHASAEEVVRRARRRRRAG